MSENPSTEFPLFIGRAIVGGNGVLQGSPVQTKLPTRYVYRICLDERPLPRLVGESKVLYIGKGTGKRVLHLWTGQHSANVRLARAAWARSQTGIPPLPVYVEVCPANAHEQQHDLLEMGRLNAYVYRHGELPPMNSRFEGWLVARVLGSLADRVSGAGTGHVRTRAYTWPKPPHGAACSVVDIFEGHDQRERGAWLATLAWVWPDSWAEEGPERTTTTEEGTLIDLRGHLLVCKPGSDGLVLPKGLIGSSSWGETSRIVAHLPVPELAGDGSSPVATRNALGVLLGPPVLGGPAEALASILTAARQAK